MWRSLLALVALSVAYGACGGSSSETPFPLEPEFKKQSASAPEREVVFSGRDEDAAAEEEIDEPEGEPGAGPPPADTWGGKPKRKRKRAPALEPR